MSYLAMWAALYAVAGIVPAIPLVGGGTFGGQEFILVIAGLIFGPVAGLIAAGVGGLLASFIAPATAYFGLLTFYPHAIGALTAGLLIRNTLRSRAVVLVMLVVMTLMWWLVPPFSSIGAPVFREGAYWPMYLTGVVGLAFSPWAVQQIRTFEPRRVALGVGLISWITYMVNHLAVSLGYSYLYPQGPDSWVFTFWSGIVPAQRIALAVIGTFIGSALIVGLHRSGIRFPGVRGSVLDGEGEH